MRSIFRSRLPGRLAGNAPPLLVERAVGLAVGAAGVGIRFALGAFQSRSHPPTGTRHLIVVPALG